MAFFVMRLIYFIHCIYALKLNSNTRSLIKISIYECHAMLKSRSEYEKQIFLIFCLNIYIYIYIVRVHVRSIFKLCWVYFSILHFIRFSIRFNGHLRCNFILVSVTSQQKAHNIHNNIIALIALKEFQTENELDGINLSLISIYITTFNVSSFFMYKIINWKWFKWNEN